MIKKLFITLFCAVLLCSCSPLKDETPLSPSEDASSGESDSDNEAVYRKMSAEEARDMILSNENCIILDVRTDEEFKEKRIDGAVLLPDYEVKNRAESELPDKNAIILIYCQSGRRSENAARELVGMGYTNVYDFGGIINWPYETISDTIMFGGVNGNGINDPNITPIEPLHEQNKQNWEVLYTDFMLNLPVEDKDFGWILFGFHLLDLDFDDIPELAVLYHSGGTLGGFYLFYHFDGAEITEILNDNNEPMKEPMSVQILADFENKSIYYDYDYINIENTHWVNLLETDTDFYLYNKKLSFNMGENENTYEKITADEIEILFSKWYAKLN